MLAGLRQHLDCHVIRNHVLLDQCAQELIFCLGCSRKTDLDHFESDIHEHLEEFQFLIQTHWLDQSLVAVSQVNAAPDRSLVDRIFLHSVITGLRRHKICLFVFLPVFHVSTSPYN